MGSSVDRFLSRSGPWREEMTVLREVLLASGLEESLKWGKPCYGSAGKNVAIMQPFKACLGLMFFKGSLLKDSKTLLVDNGPNSQAARRLEFTSVTQIKKQRAAIRAYLKEAVALETAGRTVTFKRAPEPWPDELKAALAEDEELKTAFESLTPGRQRGWILHFAGAKQAATRRNRIEKAADRIRAGRGPNDR